MNKFFLTLIVLLIVQGGIYAQNKQDKKLVTALDALIPKRLPDIAPGCVVLVAKKGKIIYEKAFGSADLGLSTPMQTDMMFRIGSITKQFTAIAILQLVEQGKISLQDSIQKYVPDYPYSGFPITIENLLTQTSGIKDYMAIDNPKDERVDYTPKQGVDYFKNEPLEFKPGSQFKYSNSNYYLLGYIIEVVTGEPYANYLQQHVFNKAEMNNTYYIDKVKKNMKVAQGYSRFDGKLEKATLENVTTIYAAGGIMSNAEDLYRWHKEIYNGKLIRQDLLDKAFTPYQFDNGRYSEYGYGWFIKKLNGSRTIEHAGSTDGFQCDEIYLPNEDVFVVTLFNCFEQDMDWTVLSNDIATLAIGKSLNSEAKVKEDVLKNYVGTYEVNVNKINHKLIVTFDDRRLSIEASNPADRLPKVFLHAKSENEFYIKEAPLRFEFIKDANNNCIKIVTYNNQGKDAEWMKIE